MSIVPGALESSVAITHFYREKTCAFVMLPRWFWASLHRLPVRNPVHTGITPEKPARSAGADSIRRTRPAAKGHEQSPIDIRGAHLNKALKPIEFHYIGGPVTLENTATRLSFTPARAVTSSTTERVMTCSSSIFTIRRRKPFSGKLTDMDVHLVHKSADGKIAVIAVRFTMDRGKSQRGDGDALAAPAQNRRGYGEGRGNRQSRRLPARRPRILDLHGFAHDASVHRGRSLVHL